MRRRGKSSITHNKAAADMIVGYSGVDYTEGSSTLELRTRQYRPFTQTDGGYDLETALMACPMAMSATGGRANIW